jgi:hypothetical protein
MVSTGPSHSKVVRFSAHARAGLAQHLQDSVPSTLRELTANEAAGLSFLEKALISITYTMRNLQNGGINLARAEREAAETLLLVKQHYQDTDL